MTKDGDGGVVVQLDAHRPGKDDDENEFYANLVDKIDALDLTKYANELVDAITADDESRKGHLDTIARGLGLLGLKLEPPKSSVSDSGTQSDGMSSVTNPLLLEAVLRGWANAQAEFLPADGPVKIKDDGEETNQEDELADAYERDMNHYLTQVAKEYYPDTTHMLLWGTYFSGSGFKKIYRCPMRRRPVSESVKVEHLIVSDTMKDLSSCARITHQIEMRPSVMKRMQLMGAYRKTATLLQSVEQPSAVETKVAGIQGTRAQKDRPEDQPYVLWESQCELDLEQFAPGKFKGEGIPLPYLVTVDKDTREILAVRRDWKEDDEECERKRMYVRWPYVPGPGFYGTGMLNILGNSSSAMTAAWREALDAGMYASFPGGLIAKGAGRQNTSNFRVSPGEFEPVQTNGMKIQDTVMPMPYKDVTAGLMAMMDKITQQSKELSGVADIPTSEGIQNVPVGTMLAQIEQATKVIAAAHKGQHTAQSEEIEMLVDLFRENPEDFWRHNKVCPQGYWDEQKFAQAVDNCKLVPVSDPNVPSHLHRVMKAMALLTLQTNPVLGPYMSAKETLTRILHVLKEDATNLLIDPAPQAPQGDPAAMIKAQAAMKDAQTKELGVGVKAQEVQQKGQLSAQDQAAKQRLADTKLLEERTIHAFDAVKEENRERHNRVMEMTAQAHAQRVAGEEAGLARQQHDLERQQHAHQVASDIHDQGLARSEHALDWFEATKPEPPAKKTT
jgi:hypothetical protein